MYAKATYEVRIDENDFPEIGQIGITEYNGVDYTVIVKEIVKLEWKKQAEVPTLLVKVIVEIDDKYFKNNISKRKRTNNKFRVIEGGK